MFFKFFIENKNFFQEIHKINKMLNNKLFFAYLQTVIYMIDVNL